MTGPRTGGRLAAGIIAILLPALALLAGPAFGHERIGSASYAIVIAQGDAVDYYLNLPPATYRLLARELDPNSPDFRDYFASDLAVKTWDTECPLTRLEKPPTEPTGHQIVHLQFSCPQPIRDLAITSHLFLDQDESHTQIVRLAPPDHPEQVLRQAVFSVSNTSFHVGDARTGGSAVVDRAWSFFRLGIEHLITGYDHILFLLAAIVAMSLIDTIKAVTAFTVAHSITMALAFLGAISLPASIVEPLIAATIVYVAVENVVATSLRWRWALTGLFGLVHGLGFVGALKEISVSREELVLSLVSFNLGIEAGQLLVIALAAPAFWYLRRRSWERRFSHAFSIGVGMLGSLWLAQRVLA